jgi:hypothetical protein
MIDTLFKLICWAFHKKLWKKIDEHSNEFFDYIKYNCLKCGTMFWDSPFDPHIPEPETPVKDLPDNEKMTITYPYKMIDTGGHSPPVITEKKE